MNQLSHLICCNDSVDYKETNEIELLKDVVYDGLASMDDSNHWKMDNDTLIDSGDDVKFIFGGSGSHWLGVEGEPIFDDNNPDSFLQCNVSDDVVSTRTGENEHERDLEYNCEDYEDDNAENDEDLKVGFFDITSRESSDRNGVDAVTLIHAMIQSSTDPVGKFLRQYGITATMAVDLNIHMMLLHAPKTPRQKYGPRHEQTMEQRLQQCKDRNRAHAKATRQRKKLFEKILAILENPSLNCGSGCDDDEEMSVES